MSEERDIEKQLRDYAEQRRKDAEAGGRFEMHPVTRRLLHGERQRVRGQAAPAAPAPKASLFAGFWPKLAWGVSMLTVLVVGTWVYVHSRQPAVTAQDRRNVIAMAGYAQKAPAPATPAPVAPVLAPPARDLASAPSRAPSGKPVTAGYVQSFAKVEQPAASEAAPAAALKKSLWKLDGPAPEAVPESSVAADTATPAAANASNARNYFNSAPLNRVVTAKDKQPATNAAANLVLNNFQFEQNGAQVHIVDQDGSVYDGIMTVEANAQNPASPADTDALQREAKNELAAVLDDEKDNATLQSYHFTATGMNVSLRQRVTIHGEFVSATNAAPAELAAGQGNALSNQQMKSTLQNGLLMSNSRVIGHAVTADGQQIELNASEVQMK